MTRKLVYLLILVMVLAPFTASIAFAAPELGSACPPGFTLELAAHHEDHEHHHQHVGTSVNLNSDQYTCVKPVTPGGTIHVHVDNILP